MEYPAVELLVGAVWLWAAFHYGANFTGMRVAAFASLLIGIAITDARYYVIPDGYTITGLIWTLVTAIAGMFVFRVSPFAGPYDALVGACVGAGAISIVGWLGEAALKKEAMGFGDVTLMAFVGAALGPGRTLLTIFIGAGLGAAVFLLVVLPVTKFRGRDNPEGGTMPLVPFGVFLAPAAFFALLWGNDMIGWYMKFTGL